VTFADVNLSEDQVRIGSPGAGGWPTFRHFNKDTGVEGVPYTDLKKTSDAMCDEMKQDKYMEGYVMEAGKTSKCNAFTLAGCGEKETKYIAKMKAKGDGKWAPEIDRLTKMQEKGSSMKESLLLWLNTRINLLQQLVAGNSKDEL